MKAFFPAQQYSFLELGCYTGLTSSVLADHFTQFLGIDIKEEYLAEARQINAGNQVQFQIFDLYNTDWTALNFEADVVLIDARHQYEFVVKDIANCLARFPNAYIIFDDYGAWESVSTAVNEAVARKELEIVQEIGAPQGSQLWVDPNDPRSYTRFGSEGVICRPTASA